MARRRRPPSQGRKTFPRNHAAGIASLDLFVVRTISFKLLYGLVVAVSGAWPGAVSSNCSNALVLVQFASETNSSIDHR